MANTQATAVPSRARHKAIIRSTTDGASRPLRDLLRRTALAAGCAESDWAMFRVAGTDTAFVMTGASPLPAIPTAVAALPAEVQVALREQRPLPGGGGLALPFPHPDGDCACLLLGPPAGETAPALAACHTLHVGLRGLSRQQQEDGHLEWMAAAVAHEVRNPLSAIKGATQYLEGKLEDELSRRFLTIIGQEADRLTRLTTNFLAYARPYQVVLRPLDLNRLVLATWELIAPQAHKHGVAACMRLHSHLPPAMGDAEALKQALMNVLLNAVQAMPQGGEVTVRTRHQGRGLAVLVRDQGEGIPEQALARIFEPFFSTKRQGSGLGLPMVKRIVEQHRGAVEVTSRPGRGTLVSISLPSVRPLRWLPAHEAC